MFLDFYFSFAEDLVNICLQLFSEFLYGRLSEKCHDDLKSVGEFDKFEGILVFENWVFFICAQFLKIRFSGG